MVSSCRTGSGEQDRRGPACTPGLDPKLFCVCDARRCVHGGERLSALGPLRRAPPRGRGWEQAFRRQRSVTRRKSVPPCVGGLSSRWITPSFQLRAAFGPLRSCRPLTVVRAEERPSISTTGWRAASTLCLCEQAQVPTRGLVVVIGGGIVFPRQLAAVHPCGLGRGCEASKSDEARRAARPVRPEAHFCLADLSSASQCGDPCVGY